MLKRDHASVKYVLYNNSQWEVVSYSTERRPNGYTFYYLIPVGTKPSEHTVGTKVNAKDCTPFVPTGGFELKGYEFGEKKTSPTEITEEMIDKAISKSIVYQEAVKALREQVAYGLRKYPEPLQYKTWNFVESIDHALSENSDKQHYLTMMKINAEFLMHIDEVIGKLLEVYKNPNPLKAVHHLIFELQQRQQELVDKYSTPNPID